ncbi:MAG: RNA-binding protein [Pseudomonadota bacterium]
MKAGEEDLNDRTCIATGAKLEPSELIRFVADPDGQIVPDIAQKLPGRGCWVSCNRAALQTAIDKKAFARSLKEKVSTTDDLPDLVERLLADDALRSFSMARKAGQAVTGFSQVDPLVRNGKALFVLHALEAAVDGKRKLDQARKATVHLGGPEIEAFQLFTSDQLDVAFGGQNVIHATILDGGAGNAALRRTQRLTFYTGKGSDRVKPGEETEYV